MNKLPREWVAAGEAWERLSKRWGYKGWEKGWGVKGGERVTQGIKRGMREREKRGKWGMDEELKHRVRETQGRDEGKSARGETEKDTSLITGAGYFQTYVLPLLLSSSPPWTLPVSPLTSLEPPFPPHHWLQKRKEWGKAEERIRKRGGGKYRCGRGYKDSLSHLSLTWHS